MKELTYTILRGENELTGNLIEIACGETKVLVECGKSIQEESTMLSAIEQRVLRTQYTAVVISHIHADHCGLASLIDKDIPVYMGNLSLSLYKLNARDKDYSNFRIFYDGVPFYVGGIRITPYRCNHSAPDSYMFLFERKFNSILYTGDFRAPNQNMFANLLERLPQTVEVLITENTNAFAQESMPTESEIRQALNAFVAQADKPVFVLCATTNIDRIVGVYKASARAGRDMLVDITQERVLETIGGSVPNAKDFCKVKIYNKRECIPPDLSHKYLDIRTVAAMNNYTMLVRTSSQAYLQSLVAEGADLFGANLVCSMWEGYQEKPDMQSFLSAIETMGIKVVTIHASGHARPQDVQRLISRLCPHQIVYVHTPTNDEI